MLSGKSYDEVCRNFQWEIPAYYNIGVDVCDRWAGNRQRLALIFIDSRGDEHRYTFWSLRKYSNQLANTLNAHGINPGDRVGILLSQRPETLISHIAVYKLGAVAVQLLTLFGPEAVEYRLADSQAKAVITDKDNLFKIHEISKRLPHLELVMVVDGGGDGAALDFWGSVQKADTNFNPVRTRPDDPALIIYTSGTTGQPKGTLHGHRLLLGILPGFEFYHNLFPQKGDLMWTPLDWAYIGGSYDALFPTLHHGCPMLAYRPRKFDPEEAFYMMAKHGVRNLMAVPTVLRMMMQAVKQPRDKFDLRLRSITAGGETMGAELCDWAREHLGVAINEQYGQTECDLVVGYCSQIMETVPGAIGRAVPGHTVEIINPGGQVAGPDELGEIAVKAPDPVMFLEYWNNPRATREKFIGDWMRTGDYGRKDNDGNFWFSGRQDDIIESGGYRIGPGEVEDCLMKHPAVALVGVIGVSDTVRGEIVKAFILPRAGVTPDRALEESIQNHVKKRLEAHAYPREVAFVDEMPRTKTGKILRNELRRIHERETKSLIKKREAPMTNNTVLYEKNDNIAIITLNRPERLNAITRELLSGLIEQLETAGKDAEVVAIILTGAGRAFCAGEDLKETSAGKTIEQWVAETDGLQQVQRVILALGKPLIAAVPGYALGGGCEFAMSCDIRIAAEEAQFGFPETEVGLTITTAGTKLLSQIVGLGKAKELVFTGDFVDAREALQIGLANKVVAAESLMDETLALARKIGEKSPLALKLSRIAIDQGLHSSFEQTLELEAGHLLTCVGAQNQNQFVASKLRKMKQKP